MDAPTNKPTVLVIEDEAGPRDALKVVLRPFFNILAAENGESALQILGREAIDLVTLDQRLPDRQGIELLQEIKLAHPSVEVIIVTGYGSLKSAMEGIRHGAAGYLLKPFNVTELINLINQTLEKKQRLDCLRDLVNASRDRWSVEQEAQGVWTQIRNQYAALAKTHQEPDTRFGQHDDWVPLLSDLLEAKDRQLFNHANRVSFYATLVATPLNFSPAEQKSLALGAFLHDLGYLALDDRLILQREQLTAGDQEALRKHPELGARMVLPLGLPAEVGQAISYHHERHDGTGYPEGLRAEGIPLVARVVSIAQVFDNLTTGRGTRHALPLEDAMKQVGDEAGSRFDPQVTEKFLQVLKEYKTSLPALVTSPTQRTVPGLGGQLGPA